MVIESVWKVDSLFRGWHGGKTWLTHRRIKQMLNSEKIFVLICVKQTLNWNTNLISFLQLHKYFIIFMVLTCNYVCSIQWNAILLSTSSNNDFKFMAKFFSAENMYLIFLVIHTQLVGRMQSICRLDLIRNINFDGFLATLMCKEEQNKYFLFQIISLMLETWNLILQVILSRYETVKKMYVVPCKLENFQ